MYINSALRTMFTLQYFCKNKETLIQTDIRMKVFGAVLIHKNASASTKSESEYALSRVSPQDIEPDAEQEPPIFAVNTLTNFQEGEEKIALCGLRWFKLNVSKCQKDVKCQIVKHVDYGGGSQKK